MEIVQTGTDTWPWCMGMFGARFAVVIFVLEVFTGAGHLLLKFFFNNFVSFQYELHVVQCHILMQV